MYKFIYINNDHKRRFLINEKYKKHQNQNNNL